MGFVKVRHTDGREAEITDGEVSFYRSMGFDPVEGAAQSVEGAAPSAAGPSNQPAAATDPMAPANGTDQRLDLVVDELRGLRADLKAIWAPAELTSFDGETIELREPASLDGMTREELNAHAESIGVAEPESFPNKAALIEAIEATQPPQ